LMVEPAASRSMILACISGVSFVGLGIRLFPSYRQHA
jgi:hypothetical protein